eukprot:7102-Hanusia_phi.AAC.1
MIPYVDTTNDKKEGRKDRRNRESIKCIYLLVWRVSQNTKLAKRRKMARKAWERQQQRQRHDCRGATVRRSPMARSSG